MPFHLSILSFSAPAKMLTTVIKGSTNCMRYVKSPKPRMRRHSVHIAKALKICPNHYSVIWSVVAKRFRTGSFLKRLSWIFVVHLYWSVGLLRVPLPFSVFCLFLFLLPISYFILARIHIFWQFVCRLLGFQGLENSAHRWHHGFRTPHCVSCSSWYVLATRLKSYMFQAVGTCGI